MYLFFLPVNEQHYKKIAFYRRISVSFPTRKMNNSDRIFRRKVRDGIVTGQD